MNREQAHEILMKYMEGENYITHSYAVEAIMRGLAKRLANWATAARRTSGGSWDCSTIWTRSSATGPMT